MNEKKVYKNVLLYGLIICILISICLYLYFNDKKIVFGFMMGSISRLIGFISIIISSSNVIRNNSPINSILGYISRMVIYAIFIYISIYYDLNIVSLLVGFTVLNLVILIVDYKAKKGVD